VSLSGNLEDVSVADALQFIHLGARTGTLQLSSGDAKAQIGFHDGRIVNAWGPGSKKLGELLLAAAVIDQPALDAALQAQKSGEPRRSLGQILVTMNAVSPETMYRAVEQQIERTVYDLVTWQHGTFVFALDDLKPVDDIAVFPGDVIRHLNLDTQMVLLDALRIFDERDRAMPAPLQPAPGAPAPEDELVPAPPPREETPQPVRLQVVTADKQLADRLEQAITGTAVERVNLRDAGLPAAGEQPPVVLVDMRHSATAPETLANFRQTRPRASVIAVIDAGVPVTQVYQAGALATVPGELAPIVACFRSLLQNRRDQAAGGSRADRVNANLARLRRIVGDLRSGLISTTISLSLMNIISESVERAVLFLARRDGLVALGAFGNSPGGQPLAQLTRGLKLALAGRNALTDSLADGQMRSMTFEAGRFPDTFAKLVGRPRSGQCAVFPVQGGERVIALIYADNGHLNQPIEELDILELAAAQAGLAFENELLRRQVPGK
jgi:hypothetical protein